MKPTTKEIILELLIPVVFILLFYGIFTLLQDEAVYHRTLGKITKTYQRVDSEWGIIDVDSAYKKIDAQNLVNWDVVGYNYIKDPPAQGEIDVRQAYGFFPMFPWLWRLTGISVKYIGVFNFLLFSFTLLILLHLFLRNPFYSPRDRILIFIACLSFPSVSIFLIPYSEALFAAAFFLALWGLARKNYWIYFV
ncbi:MAG: hypothetical protein IH596_12565, partial [Bacteroidales bacterium]|nr:hypothetical protein [Bacteroidales bacterium]